MVGTRKVWIEVDGLAIVVFGLLMLPQIGVGIAAIKVGTGEIRLKYDDLVEVLDGFIVQL